MPDVTPGEGQAALDLLAQLKLPKQVGVLATPTERLQWLLNDRTRLQNELAEAAHEINCSGPVAHRIRVLQQEHGRRVERMEGFIETLGAALREVGVFMDERRGILALSDELTDDENTELEKMIALCFNPQRTGLTKQTVESESVS